MIRAVIGGDTLYDGKCPDPPCHEQMAIPSWAAGETLVVTLSSADAQPVVRRIAIAQKDSSTGGLAAAN